MNAYIGVDGGTYRELIQPTKITITRAEGPTAQCDIPRETSTWAGANSILRVEATTAPATGGYDKHDFVVLFADGYEYSGRYDLKHWSVESPDLAAHCRGFIQHCNAATQIGDLLNTHDFGQDKVPVPPDVTPNIVNDYRRDTAR